MSQIRILQPAPPTCESCSHSSLVASEPWEGGPAYAACNHAVQYERQEQEDAAVGCPSYVARRVRTCGHCRIPINLPEGAWTLWAYDPLIGEPYAVCSETCKADANAQGERDVARELEAQLAVTAWFLRGSDDAGEDVG